MSFQVATHYSRAPLFGKGVFFEFGLAVVFLYESRVLDVSGTMEMASSALCNPGWGDCIVERCCQMIARLVRLFSMQQYNILSKLEHIIICQFVSALHFRRTRLCMFLWALHGQRLGVVWFVPHGVSASSASHVISNR